MLKCLPPKRPITRLSFARDETPPGLKPLFVFRSGVDAALQSVAVVLQVLVRFL